MSGLVGRVGKDRADIALAHGDRVCESDRQLPLSREQAVVVRMQQTVGNAMTARVLAASPGAHGPVWAPVSTRRLSAPTIQRVKARFDTKAQELRLQLPEGERVVKVVEGEPFLGAAENAEAFAYEQRRKLLVLKESTSEKRWVYDELEQTATEYDEFMRKQTWRSYAEQPGEPGQLSARGGLLPGSTKRIPLTYYKLVNVDHLGSIAKEGLGATGGRVAMGGYSKGTPYVTRDLKIAAAAWLGVDTTPGELMKPTEGVFATLRIQVPAGFRDAYMRGVQAVLHGKHGEDDEPGKTILCFSPIPPEYLFISDEELETIERLKGVSLANMKPRDRLAVERLLIDKSKKAPAKGSEDW